MLLVEPGLLLQGADLFALTSHSENFGMAVLEAMANGLPVLVTPGVALAQFVERSCLGWGTPLDHASIAATLQHFFNNRAQAKQMGEDARAMISQHYSWDWVVASLVKYYQ